MHKSAWNPGDEFAHTTVYYFDGQKIIETRNGSNVMVQQFIHGTRYIDELVQIRVKGEQRERERAAMGKAGRDARVRPTTCPNGASTKRATGGKGDLYVHQDANWNVTALTDLGGSVVERYQYTPYGEVTVQQAERDQDGSVKAEADRDGDADVDSTDKGTVGVTCTGTVTGACRILDLDFDGDYDSTDATKFDSLTQGQARHPGKTSTGVDQPFAHQGLLFEPELASYQNRARQYEPGKRRFHQRDPLPFLRSPGVSSVKFGSLALYQAFSGSRPFRTQLHYYDSVNPYTYTIGNPLNYNDPSGTICIPYYGNWCGPGWGGGQCYNACGELQNNALPPIDEWDQCCFEHDSCYAYWDCGYPCPYCDTQACECLRDTGAPDGLTAPFCR